ncbi:MAG: ATPase V [Treponema sp.]|nr:ATPase V [Treponema sp.]
MQYFVIGERELVLAFSLVGVKGAVATNRTEAIDVFNRVTGKGDFVSGVPVTEERAKILIITEEVSVMLEEEVTAWQLSGKYPLIVEISGINGRMKGKKSLTETIREAIGISV